MEILGKSMRDFCLKLVETARDQNVEVFISQGVKS